MDADEKISLVMRPPTEEAVTEEELRALFESNDSPNHYIGLEISGFLHLGSLISTGFKVNDMARAGVRCTIFLADWHTVINDKLGGDWETISRVAGYYRRAFGAVCPEARIVLGSDLYEQSPKYWEELVRFAKHMSVARTKRALTIMGRSETDSLDLAKLLYPPMQAADIHSLDLDIVHSGMDQRKIHMLVRGDIPQDGLEGARRRTPLAAAGALGPLRVWYQDEQVRPQLGDTDARHRRPDQEKDIQGLVRGRHRVAEPRPGDVPADSLPREGPHRGWSAPKGSAATPHITGMMRWSGTFAGGKLHPADLKRMVGAEVAGIVGPVRDAISLDEELADTIRRSV